MFLIRPTNLITALAYTGIVGQLLIGKLIIGTTQKVKGFLNISGKDYIFSDEEDLRIIKVNNSKDIVPKAGSLINRQHNQSIIIDNITEKSLFTIPGVNIPIKLDTDYHDKALYFMPFVKEYAKRKDATNVVLKERIDFVLNVTNEIKNNTDNTTKSIVNIMVEEVNSRILKFKENMKKANNVSYGNELRI